MVLLDTDVMIDLQRKYPPAVVWYYSLDEQPSLPGLVVMEMVQFAHNKKQVDETLKFVTPFPIVWPNERDCTFALAHFTFYHLSHNLGLLDSLIGSCAVGCNATLFTFNLKHYKTISGLIAKKPYKKNPPSGKKP